MIFKGLAAAAAANVASPAAISLVGEAPIGAFYLGSRIKSPGVWRTGERSEERVRGDLGRAMIDRWANGPFFVSFIGPGSIGRGLIGPGSAWRVE